MCKNDQETVSNFANFTMMALPAPCHTIGSTLYYLETKIYDPSLEHNSETISPFDNQPCYNVNKLIFTGDTIFIGGCGKFFEGNGPDMEKIITRVKKLNLDTRIFCGHDYAESNMNWAAGIEWENVSYENCKKWIYDRKKGPHKDYVVGNSIGMQNEMNIFCATK